MKTKEQIEKRITDSERQIVYLREMSVLEMAEVTKKIADNANDPGYITKWMESWMSGVNHFNAQITELEKEVRLLAWTIAD